MKFRIILFLMLLSSFAFAQQDAPTWRQATAKELASIVPERAPVEKERIETELKTASGATDGKGHFIVGAVLITAGYSAHGKYTHFLIVQTAIRVGDVMLTPGEYVFGYRRLDEDTLEMLFYEAATGKLLGTGKAVRESRTGPIRSLLVTPPSAGKSVIQIGRFACEYKLAQEKK